MEYNKAHEHFGPCGRGISEEVISGRTFGGNRSYVLEQRGWDDNNWQRAGERTEGACENTL